MFIGILAAFLSIIWVHSSLISKQVKVMTSFVYFCKNIFSGT